MLTFQGPYRTSAMFFALSGILHIIVPIVALFSQDTLAFAVVGVVYILISRGLSRAWRWLAYIAFLIALFGSVAAFSGASGAFGPLAVLFWLILIADLVAMVALFIKLWQPKSG